MHICDIALCSLGSVFLSLRLRPSNLPIFLEAPLEPIPRGSEGRRGESYNLRPNAIGHAIPIRAYIHTGRMYTYTHAAFTLGRHTSGLRQHTHTPHHTHTQTAHIHTRTRTYTLGVHTYTTTQDTMTARRYTQTHARHTASYRAHTHTPTHTQPVTVHSTHPPICAQLPPYPHHTQHGARTPDGRERAACGSGSHDRSHTRPLGAPDTHTHDAPRPDAQHMLCTRCTQPVANC